MYSTETGGIPESVRYEGFLTNRLSYHGRSGRIKGFNDLSVAIGSIPSIRTVDPVILLEKLYAEYVANGISTVVKDCAAEIFSRLKGNEHELIVRRLFPDQNGDAQEGGRSGNVRTADELTIEIGRFYDYFSTHYSTTEVAPEIMVHRVVDTGSPPLRQEPFLPHPGGTITPIGPDTYQILSLWGADESSQGYPCDEWTAEYTPDGGVIISGPTIAHKDHSKIPAPERYKEIEIPEVDQDRLSLSRVQLLSLVEVAKNLSDKRGPHRLEFDGTIIDGQQSLVIIEAAPFKEYKNSYECLRPLGDNIVRPLNIITSSNDIQALPSGELAVVHLPPQMFQGNDMREQLTDIALTAKARDIPLVVLVAGSGATQHAVRVIRDNHHVVWFTRSEEFDQGEEIRMFETPEGGYDWERENPIVPQEKVQCRQIKRIGGKALGLQKLDAHGFPTSPYFVLETSVWRRVISDLGLNEAMVRLDQLSPADKLEHIATFTAPIAEKIIQYTDGQIPDLTEARARIGGDESAVRSTATQEDGRVSSFGGIFDSELNVKDRALYQAIRNVLASEISPLAVKATLGASRKPSKERMAIIVQRMVNPMAAGTIFTKEHLEDNNDIIRIEVARGLGEHIVNGSARTVDTQSILISRETGEILENDVSGEDLVLDDDQIRELAGIGLAVEKALAEGPQDIEWAIDKTGKVFLLQTRPL